MSTDVVSAGEKPGTASDFAKMFIFVPYTSLSVSLSAAFSASAACASAPHFICNPSLLNALARAIASGALV